MSRFNAIRQVDVLWPALESALQPLGFARIGNVFHRRTDDDLLPRLEAITFGFEYGCRTCWMQATVKVPALIQLLHGVREFAYRPELAWRVPDFASHLACMVRLSEMGAVGRPLPEGLSWGYDGRLRRARPVPAEVLAETLATLAKDHAWPLFDRPLTLQGLAAAADAPAYATSGAGGGWPLAARLALNDLDGAEQAFRRHPYSLGNTRSRLTAAKDWLWRQGVDVRDVSWSLEAAEISHPLEAKAWLAGSLVTGIAGD
ncbi:hypothetical protein [Roseateles terrae]|uniref:Uncharacterized protein n=1 Tax=Roseateles terrae TaxID=431060 RepID=A0ABR6GXK7_9BURK|nr:hypothetical protein [Roseateles terrae]MBB3196838.1 hypothetical protein [Roseateles terrae]OWQ84602.1 hypothetical protein CDN98_19075 [Roseateles terrae]